MSLPSYHCSLRMVPWSFFNNSPPHYYTKTMTQMKQFIQQSTVDFGKSVTCHTPTLSEHSSRVSHSMDRIASHPSVIDYHVTNSWPSHSLPNTRASAVQLIGLLLAYQVTFRSIIKSISQIGLLLHHNFLSHGLTYQQYYPSQSCQLHQDSHIAHKETKKKDGSVLEVRFRFLALYKP